MTLVQAPVNKVCYFEAQCTLRQRDMGPVGLGGSDNFLVLNRYDYGAIYPPIGTSIGVDSSPRFNTLRFAFREFAITGMKIEITPNDR